MTSRQRTPATVAFLLVTTFLVRGGEGQGPLSEPPSSETGGVAITFADTPRSVVPMLVSPSECNVLVLCPDELFESLGPWIEYRYRQGFRILVQAPGNNAWRIKRQIRSVASGTRLTHIVLVGDTPDYSGRNRGRSVATDYVPAEIVSQYGSEPEIATDNGYADFDDDGLPDVAIGRLPADTPAQLDALIVKVIDYESAAPGVWQRQINLVAGTGGFGELTDGVIEKASRGMIAELIPDDYSVSLTWANWSSAYCPDPREFTKVTLDRLNEGCLFWVYMGHGQPTRLDYVRTPVGGYPMLSTSDIDRCQCQAGAPIALLLACYTGAFDLPGDSLGEQLVLQPGGPVAAVCSSRASMPWGMSTLSLGLIEEYFGGDRPTLGEMILVAKRRLAEDIAPDDSPLPRRQPLNALPAAGEVDMTMNMEFRHTIRLLGETFSPTGDKLAAEAREHVHLFHLLGDPLLHVQRPMRIELETIDDADATGKLLVRGKSPGTGKLLLELEYARDRMRFRSPRRDEFRDDPRSLAAYQEVYEQANRRTVTHVLLDVEAGDFEAELEVPAEARGRCVVKAFMASAPDRCALGASPVRIHRR